MNFDLPSDLTQFLGSLDSFIDTEILPLQNSNDNNRFFDHRREFSRTDWSKGGLPTIEWEALLTEARSVADKAGFYRFALPGIYGGKSHPQTNLWMTAIRYHLASHPIYGGGLGLANDLQNEHSVVGNFPDILMIHHFGSEDQRQELIPLRLEGKFRATFGLTEPDHGSDATFMETVAIQVPGGFEISGAKKWQTGAHHCTHFVIFARTSGTPGSSRGITAFLVPREAKGTKVVSYEWTMNMPTDHATVTLDRVFTPAEAVLGNVGEGLAIAQTFVHENRLRQAASSCGAARFCLERGIDRAKNRKIWGAKSLSENQGIQFPVVELVMQVEMLRLLILKTSVDMDRVAGEAEREGRKPWVEIEKKLSDKVAMAVEEGGANGSRSTGEMDTRAIIHLSTFIGILDGIELRRGQKKSR
ncbi:acyl-CoA dehydrogenase family protein [Aspergillus affinis]|uniref:acyl-CoA dehydrogenase family protein n=1 Tax=Aspergillus affinis TaxID=1070780 RepID=UPI0022FEE8B3|nr:acyl-CoA dehydrogenase family protein [Aspergillus affinis]KAI9045972.1 acyl-CoA dehydrogenase family protein [Aspergillus affinis]